MSRKTKIIILVILLIIDLVLAYRSYNAGQAPAYDLVEARKGEITQIVSATGSVTPASQIKLQFTTSGKITNVAVKINDKVSAGKVLVSQDTSDLVFQAQAAEAALQVALAKLNQLLAGSSEQEIALAQTAVANAQKSLDDAEKSLTNAKISADNALVKVYQDIQRTLDVSLLTLQNSLKTNSDTLESTDLESTFSVLDSQALIDAKALRITAEADYNTAKVLVSQATSSFDENKIDQAANVLKMALNSAYAALGRTYDAVVATVTSSSLTQTKLDTFKSNVAAARANLNTALTNIVSGQQAITSQKITNQANLDAAQANVTAAQGALQTAKDQLVLKQAGPRQVDIDLGQAQVRQAQAALDQIKNQIAQKNIVAPIDGVITDVLVEKGETAGPGQNVVLMNSLSNFEIKAEIPESDIAKIKVGDSVKITFDAFGKNEIWSGNVIKIDPAQIISQGVVYYRITVGLLGDDSKIKAGMTANLDIETARHNDALIIPARAVKEDNGKKIVKILDGGQIKDVIIETGLKNTSGEIEVLSGLIGAEKLVIPKTQ